MRALGGLGGAICILGGALAVGCGGERVFTCLTSEDCDAEPAGFCQPTHECSHADATCPSGQRYGRYAVDARRDRCAPADLTTGLRVRLAFDEGAGGTAADLSGNGFTAMIVGSPRWTDGHWGKAIELDGTSGRATVPAASMRFGRDSFSAFAWVRSRDQDGPQSRVLGAASASSLLFLNYGNGRPAVEAQDAAGAYWSTTSASDEVGDGAWHHLGLVCDRQLGSMALYVDGKVSVSSTGVRSSGTFGDEASTQVVIGGQNDSSALSLDGAVDDVWVFARALSAVEVGELFAPGMARAP